MKNKDFSKTIIELRKQKGLTQEELARELNTTDKSVSRWETGTGYPTLEMIEVIADYFNVDFDDLMDMRLSKTTNKNSFIKDLAKDYIKIKKEHKIEKVRVFNFISIIITIFLSVLIISITRNRFKVYRVCLESNDFYISDGIYVETRIKDTLYLNNIILRNYDLKNDDVVHVNLYYKENGKAFILQSYDKLNNIQYNSKDSYINIKELSPYFNDLYIKVIIISDNETKEYIGKLQFVTDFSNSKIYHEDDDEKSNLKFKYNYGEIKKVLLDNGFAEKPDNYLIKDAKGIRTYYWIDELKINLCFEKDNIDYVVLYDINTKYLYVTAYNEQNTEIDNYIYDIFKKKIIKCNIGSCSDYDYMINVLNKNILKYLE